MTQTNEMSKDEQIGFHKGSISTLAKEREELLKMANVVEQIMEMHLKALKELGINLTNETQAAPKKDNNKKKVAIEDLL